MTDNTLLAPPRRHAHEPAHAPRSPALAAGPHGTLSSGAALIAPFGLDADAAPDLSANDFERVRRLIHQRAGIHLAAGKQAMVVSRLGRRLRETGQRSFVDYLQWLESARGDVADAEWQAFVNALTTNLTAFFREPHHFDLLATDLRAMHERAGGRPLRLWCSAASTGEEPYSIAMTVDEVLGAQAEASLLATDIDTRVLEQAQRGVYAADSRGLGPDRLRRHFLRGTGQNAGSIRVRPALARQVGFRPFNLVGDGWDRLGGPFDIVFCRNVMIYFDRPTQARVLQRLRDALRPGGLLFAGHSENFTDMHAGLRLRGKTVYVRT
jgi:chemotaxis protein methyltransferase CheR